jgi:sporulation related protein/tetratricopeptide repeat protein
MLRRVLYYSLMLGAALAVNARAQARPTTAADSVFARARLLVAGGNGAAGRVLVDSMLTVATPGSPAYADALYWRASLAATGADAESDFRRVIVEYPLSSHAGDALLQLAQLEVARGDRAAAIPHLERFLLENPKSPERPRIALLLVRLAFEQNEPQTGCVFLTRVLAEIPDSEVELRNQLGYYTPRCAAVDTTHLAEAATPVAADSTKRDTGKRDTTSAASHEAKGKFTLQIAAYTTRAEADRLAKRLKDRGVDARVVGTAKLFRVRVGRYETRAAAAAAQKELKAKKKIDAFITEASSEDK